MTSTDKFSLSHLVLETLARFIVACVDPPSYNDDLTIPAGFSVELIEAGFSTDTRVSVRDVYKEDHLGWHTFTYKTARAIPPHGVILLRLSYSPQYAAVVL